MGLIIIAGAQLKDRVRAAGVEPTTFGSGNRTLYPIELRARRNLSLAEACCPDQEHSHKKTPPARGGVENHHRGRTPLRLQVPMV